MSRTTVDVDDELIGRVMRRYPVDTKQEAVELALVLALPDSSTREELLELRGIGWDGDLDAMRADRSRAWSTET